MSKPRTLTLTVAEPGRLDKALVDAYDLFRAENPTVPDEGLSRMRFQRLIKEGCVTESETGLSWSEAKAKVALGTSFLVTLPAPVQAEPEAQDIPLKVLYEDADVLVLDKPAGLVVHPAAGHKEGTLVNALLAHCGSSLSGIGGVARPGIVHRLDKETSGLLVVAKNDQAHQALTRQFADRSLGRVYQALVWGIPNPLEGEVEAALGRHPRARQKMAVVSHGGKDALTRYRVIETFGTLASLVECRLATGRTHQIRVHMEHIGHPVIGDPVYGSRRRALPPGEKGLVAALEAFPRQALHAGEIHFVHPKFGKPLKFKAPLPDDFKGLLKRLRRPT